MTDTTQTPETTDAPAAAGQLPANPYGAPYVAPAPSAPSAGNALSIAAFVLGIASIPTGIALAGIAAIVLGFVARSKEPAGRTLSTWGLALGFVGVFGWLIVALIGVVAVVPFMMFGAGWGWGF